MPLNLSVGDGDFTPFLKYNAKAGRFYARPDGGAEEVEIVNPTLVFDMANIKTGWLYFPEGAGPEKVWDPSLEQQAPKPSGKFKRGFEVMVYSNGIIPGTTQKLGLREFVSTAMNVNKVVSQMWDDYRAGLTTNSGSLPIFSCNGVKPINGAYGVNYEPLFVLKGWIPRSRVPEFDEHETSTPAPARPKPTLAVASSGGGRGPSENPADFTDDIPF